MNGKELAAALGLSEAMVSKLRQRGMPTSSVEAAEKWRRRHLAAARTKGMRMGTAPSPPAAQQLAEADDGDESADAYRADRARNERIKAERAEIELQQLRGEVVSVRDVEELQFTAGRITRDRVLMVPARVAADLHGLLLTLIPEEHRGAFAEKVPVHAFEHRLDDALRDALTEAERAIEDAGRDDDE